jgi:hypothetical protein
MTMIAVIGAGTRTVIYGINCKMLRLCIFMDNYRITTYLTCICGFSYFPYYDRIEFCKWCGGLIDDAYFCYRCKRKNNYLFYRSGYFKMVYIYG